MGGPGTQPTRAGQQQHCGLQPVNGHPPWEEIYSYGTLKTTYGYSGHWNRHTRHGKKFMVMVP